jgi:hypothetical protein
MSIICDICGSTVSHIKNIQSHKRTDKCLKVKEIVEKKYTNYTNEISILKQENLSLILELKKLQDKILLLEKENMMNKEKAEEYRKIVEKTATKTTIKNNYTHNNYLNYISSEPLKLSEIQNKIKDVVTTKTIMWDDTDFHNHIVDNILKDDDGKDKVLCTDINRKNFSYKDENSGELISDPELERLREQLRKGADVKSLKRELLEKLIKKYDGTATDPYKKFYDMLQKLEFGTPFVDHVAKKTYIKTKSGNEKNEDESTINF